MGTVEGIFVGESRVYAAPFMDLNGQAPGSLAMVTNQGVPMQFGVEGPYGIFGWSGLVATPAAGGLPNLTPINIRIQEMETSKTLQLSGVPSQGLNQLGEPFEHLCGKAGAPGFKSYFRMAEPGSKLNIELAHLAAATPTGRSPVYLVAHTVLLKPSNKGLQIGSKYYQQQTYRGEYREYSGFLNFTDAAPLPPNATADLVISVTGRKYFFVDTIYARMVNAQLGPVNYLHPLQQEDEVLCSIADTSNPASFNLPSFVPVWTLAGHVGGAYYHPPSAFVIRPNGNIKVTLKNGPTANINYRVEFTFGGCIVDAPSVGLSGMLA